MPQVCSARLVTLSLRLLALLARPPTCNETKAKAVNNAPAVEVGERAAAGARGLDAARRARGAWIGFNSLGAHASVNNFHTHLGYAADVCAAWGAPDSRAAAADAAADAAEAPRWGARDADATLPAALRAPRADSLPIARAPRTRLARIPLAERAAALAARGAALATGGAAVDGGASALLGEGAALELFTVDWPVPAFAFLLDAPARTAAAAAAAPPSAPSHPSAAWLGADATLLGAAAGRLLERLAAAHTPHHFLAVAESARLDDSEGGGASAPPRLVVFVLPRALQRPSFDGGMGVALLEVCG
jgi:hypothetical protein